MRRWSVLATLAAVLAVWSSRSAAEEPAKPEAKAEVYQTWPFDAAEAKRRQEETSKRLGIPVEKTLDRADASKGLIGFRVVVTVSQLSETPTADLRPLR